MGRTGVDQGDAETANTFVLRGDFAGKQGNDCWGFKENGHWETDTGWLHAK